MEEKLEIMDDKKFIKETFPKISVTYNEAKEAYKLFPRLTLINLRIILEELANLIIENKGGSTELSNLSEKIRVIRKCNYIRGELVCRFHEIKNIGNESAHKVFSESEDGITAEIALKYLKLFCELVDDVYLSIFGKTVPFNFIDDASVDIKDCFYKALVFDEDDSKYKSAVFLLKSRELRLEKARLDNEIYFSNYEYINAFKFLDSITSHPEGLLLRGVMHYHGWGCQSDKLKAADDLYRSAEFGNNDARFNFGYIVLEDSIEEWGFERGLDQLKQSAELGNSEAQYYLSSLYKNGKFVKKDRRLYRDYLFAAAENNNKPALIEFIENIKKEKSNEHVYVDRIKELMSLGMLEAKISYAQHLHFDKHMYAEAISIYDDILKVEDNITIEIFRLIAKSYIESDFHSIKSILYKLSQFYIRVSESSNDSEMLKIIENRTPELIKECGHLFFEEENRDCRDNFFIFLYFKKNGKPRNGFFDTAELLNKVSDGLNNHDYDMSKYDFYTPKKRKQSNVKPAPKKPSRNDLCYCGSGKKYKHCHLK